MSKQLQDPDLPPGAVVEVQEDGTAIRNDGKRLKPAEKNPWYVLSTIAGVQKDASHNFKIDADLAARNRRFWNGWACADLNDAALAARAERLKLPVADLAPLSADEHAKVKAAFRDRLGPDVPIPEPSERIDFRETHFPHKVDWAKCVFPDDAFFESATFSEYAFFGYATFSGDASFESATFSWYVSFGYATFNWPADFSFATFSQPVWFKSATFSGVVLFKSATFSRGAWFSDGALKSGTDFRQARFQSRVPLFFGCDLHQDTALTTEESFWPRIDSGNAEDGKRAYVRLRQLMNGLHKPDDEHFFFRQEMRCDAVLKSGPDAWIVRLFGFVSGFGFSVMRPLAGLVLVIAVGGILLGSQMTEGLGPQTVPAIFRGLALSFSNTFAFFGFHRVYFDIVELQKLPAWLQWLGGAQTVLGVVLLFFLGLALRNRFRLK